MAVDKIYPKRLNLDDDIRLLEEGDMVHAENATLTKYGTNNTNGVLSSAYGNSAVGGFYVPSGSTVIGSVSDNENQCIYFFTKGTAQAVYKYTYGGGIDLVFQSTWLKFNDVDFVKADVISGNFGQRESAETILYFTDSVNPPRKINVDRAIDGDFNGLTNDQLDLALNCIKGALTYPPAFRFDSDESVDGNNLKSDSFQFATQLIYKDGEESALSAYSALAASKYYFDEGVGEKTVFDRGQNVCVIDLKWYDNASKYKDVVKIRLLGRVGNNGNFFVIDDLPTNKTLHREVYGQRKLVWNHLSGQYRFYNSVVYDYVPETTVNKLYDAVPFTATGQAIVSNRLFFSDYTEFRPNGDNDGNPIRAELSPVYIGSLLNTPEFAGNFFDYPAEENGLEEGFIDVDFLQYDWAVDGNPTTSISVIPYGANTFIRFRYKPTSASLTPDPLVIEFYDGNDMFEVGFDVDVDFGDGLTVDYQNFISQETSVEGLCDQYINFLENTSYEVTFSNSTLIFGQVISSQSANYQPLDPFGISDVSITATISFEATTPNSSLQFQIKPYVSNIQLNSFAFSEPVTYHDDWYVNQDLLQDGYNFSSVTNTAGYIVSQHVEADTGTYSSGFKWGCSHDFGVVYYDEYNRSGFVNELGSVYVKHPAERDSGEGNLFAGVEISFANSTGDDPWYSYAPNWAKSFQIVYTGRTSYSDFLTYTTANAYPAKNAAGSFVNEGKIYLSLKTLDQYQEEKSALRDYSFTPGDKLRVVSYDNYDEISDTYTTVYPSANDGRIIEFDVVDVVVLSSDNNPLATVEDLEEKHKGTFLVLDHPEITSGNLVSVNEEQVNLKYVGFDWYQITGSQYPGDNEITNLTSYWGRNCIVEILSSRKSEGSRAYYEIGERHPIVAPIPDRTSNHGAAITTFNGDIWWKKVACKSAKGLSANSWNTGAPQSWTYFRNYIETASINDFKPSEDWSKGRAHYVFDKAATFRRKNGITYSDAYEQDVDNLSLSSFNLSLSNFSYIDRQFGALNYIGNFNGNLVGIQDNKMSLIPIQGSIISYSEGQSGLAISTDVINKEQYSSGDFGVSKKDLPSVLQKDNQVYFFDRSRNAILRYAGDQLTPITEKGVKNFFYREFNNNLNTDVISGYDPLIDSYFFTKKGDFTISYNVGLGVWQSFHEFDPQFYAYMNDTMFTFNPHATNPEGQIMWSHGGTDQYPNYYGSQGGSLVVEVYSKINPSKVKTFNAISTESSRAFRAEVSSELNYLTSQNESTLIEYTSFIEKEGVFYSQVYKKMDDSHKFYVGTCTSSDTNEIQTDMYLGRHALPLGAYLYVEDNNTLSPAIVNGGGILLKASYYGNDKIGITPSNDYDFLGKEVYVGGPNKANGSHLRGRWMKIRLSSSSPNTHIYCINAHIAESKLTHTFNQ